MLAEKMFKIREKKYAGKKKYTANHQKGVSECGKKNISTEKKIYRVCPKGVSEWARNLFPGNKNIRNLW